MTTFKWTARICWMKDGVHDYMDIEGPTIEDLQRQGAEIVERRKPDEHWSERVKEWKA